MQKSLQTETSRNLTTLRRPTIFPSSFSSPSTTTTCASPSLVSTPTGEAPLDLLAKPSQHPSLLSQQIRCGPRNTYDPSHFVRKRRHGFLSRIRTRTGRAILKRRKQKKRSTL